MSWGKSPLILCWDGTLALPSPAQNVPGVDLCKCDSRIRHLLRLKASESFVDPWGTRCLGKFVDPKQTETMYESSGMWHQGLPERALRGNGQIRCSSVNPLNRDNSAHVTGNLEQRGLKFSIKRPIRPQTRLGKSTFASDAFCAEPYGWTSRTCRSFVLSFRKLRSLSRRRLRLELLLPLPLVDTAESDQRQRLDVHQHNGRDARRYCRGNRGFRLADGCAVLSEAAGELVSIIGSKDKTRVGPKCWVESWQKVPRLSVS